ncbi:MAG: DNA polymerase IV [Crocinitomicaceae bacterium]|nr:DNA polymerase IV [Crocinitomicaceae bacterium]MDG2463860.1 DNA polymerase IV [Crocinitomicaceae bacterium]
MRKIIHIDMDAFYASVEQRDNPELKGKPVAVSGGGERGVVAAASYEARKFGVRSAMNGQRAKELCPELIFVRPRFEEYKKVSNQIRAVFQQYTDIIEPLSLDEAYLDITENKMRMNSATFLAQSIKTDIFNVTNLRASAGVSYNKFLAKLASDEDKPNGLFVITPDEGKAYVEQLTIHKFHGVGKATAERMKEIGIFKGKDLLAFSEEELTKYFGKSGGFFFKIARGIDNREVRSEHERKSVGVENTFQENISDDLLLWEEAKRLLKTLWSRQEKTDKKGRTLSLKIRFANFQTLSRSKTVETEIDSEKDLMEIAVELYNDMLPLENPVRLIGYSLSSFDKLEVKPMVETQLTLHF